MNEAIFTVGVGGWNLEKPPRASEKDTICASFHFYYSPTKYSIFTSREYKLMNLQSSPFLDRILFSERQILLRPICSTFTISQKILGSGTTADILRSLVLDPVRTILIRIPTLKVSFEDVCSSYSIYARC